jgi:hypothetical protein
MFMNVQTEVLLTKILGETALSTVNMAGMANASLYGFEDYHSVDIGVVRAVRATRDWHCAVRRASKLLVLSRVSGEKVLPWMLSTAENVKCLDTVSLSQKLRCTSSA